MRILSCFFLIVFIGCSAKKNVYNEADYILVRSDSLNGFKGTEWFIYKFDTSRKLQVDYFGDGKLMSKVFSYKNQFDGKRVVYDLDGMTPIAIDSFSDGVKLTSWRASPPDTTVKFYSNGKIKSFMTLDSLEQ